MSYLGACRKAFFIFAVTTFLFGLLPNLALAQIPNFKMTFEGDHALNLNYDYPYDDKEGVHIMWPALTKFLSGGSSYQHVSTIVPANLAYPNQYAIWLANNSNPHRGRSLGVQIHYNTPVPPDDIRQKAVLHILKHSNAKARIDITETTPRFVSFYVMFPSHYEPPPSDDDYALHFQVWQQSSKPPPFAIYSKAGSAVNSPIELIFVSKSDSNPRSTDPNYFRGGRIIGRLAVARNSWKQLVFELLPSHTGDSRTGHIKVWLNTRDGSTKGANNQIINYAGDWGYQPAPATPKSVAVTPYMGINIGVYRTHQARQQILFFDDVRVGPHYTYVTTP